MSLSVDIIKKKSNPNHNIFIYDVIDSTNTEAKRIAEEYDNAVILMHDAVGKESTIEALPIIIEQILELPDTSFHAIDDETVPVQHIKATE